MIDRAQIVEHCFAELEANPLGELAWQERVKVWKLMNEVFLEEAIIRRGVLSLNVAMPLLEGWCDLGLSKSSSALPGRFLNIGRDFLLGRLPRDKAMSSFDAAFWEVESVAAEVTRVDSMDLTLLASVAACLDCLEDKAERPMWIAVERGVTEGEVETNDLECHYLAGVTTTHAYPRGNRAAILSWRSFWHGWIDGPLRATLGTPIERLLKSVES